MYFRTLTLLGCVPIALGHNFYVSPDGCEGNCSSGTTWSLQGAKEAVRQSIARGMTEDITVHIADGIYYLDEPLRFTSADSGQNGHTVLWQATGSNAMISGGHQITAWTRNSTNSIWEATVPIGTKSRNLYVNGWAANYARHELNRTYFTATNTSFMWNSSEYDWLMTTPGIAHAELRQIGSFTDRYAPIAAVGERELIMSQWSWHNQVEGYDDFVDPYADFGLFVQNALPLLDEGGEFYLDSDRGKVYYMPLDGEDMSTAETFLGLLEAIVVIGGSLDDPAHDISMQGLNFVRVIPSS
ncbi:hypothetical protein N7474_009517 [Penicillium riverlandense]|uniref:uncharacterized protein n=1 Tax=Penicillium riverlandense TaxID=1903569 RepID=UPI0025489D01|nr:uncharacterized protein N7474_009517 [Penicillium riverlandense]KAJ5808248.1 hypothetical protein N7474_009517 [Penicillium riverlandense]